MTKAMGTVRVLAWCGIIAPLLRLSLIVSLGALDPDYSQVRDYISELSAKGAPFAFTMNAFGLSLVGGLLIAFSAALYRAARPGFFAALGTALLASSGLAFMVVALFPCDPGCSLEAPSATMRVHVVAGATAMATQTLAPIAFGVHFAQARAKRYAVVSLALGTVALIALVLLFGLGSGLTWPGLPQKIFQFAADIWVLISAIFILRYRR